MAENNGHMKELMKLSVKPSVKEMVNKNSRNQMNRVRKEKEKVVGKYATLDLSSIS